MYAFIIYKTFCVFEGTISYKLSVNNILFALIISSYSFALDETILFHLIFITKVTFPTGLFFFLRSASTTYQSF